MFCNGITERKRFLFFVTKVKYSDLKTLRVSQYQYLSAYDY